jgi:DNA (cytosine-5)-methyltransferase 1
MSTRARVGSLFSGYGGLDMAASAFFGAETAWFVEFDAAPSRILAHHYADVPNYGDITAVDWSTVAPVDILTGGFPCQDVSLAGLRRGLKEGTRSGLWSEFARAIDALRPSVVLIENVRGLLSAEAAGNVEPDPWAVGDGQDGPALRALGAVLGDLADLGYDAEWTSVRAADAGAPHGRFRVFVVAYPAGSRWVRRASQLCGASGHPPRHGEGTATHSDRRDRGGRERAPRGRAVERAALAWGGDGSSSDAGGHDPERRGTAGDMAGTSRPGPSEGDQRERDGHASLDHVSAAGAWGPYAAAVERWERVTGRVAPAPTNPDGREGGHRLSARFVEWMMGLPDGWVTDPAIGLTRNNQLKALGNGVVPQQALLALQVLASRAEVAA